MKFVYFITCCLAITTLLTAATTNNISKLSDDTRKKVATEIMANLSKENYEGVRKDFHASLKSALPTEKIADVWKNIVSINGDYERILNTTTAVTQGANQVLLRCKFKNDNATLETTFNEDDKVIAIFFKP